MCATTTSGEPAEADTLVSALASDLCGVVLGDYCLCSHQCKEGFKQFHLFLHVPDAEPGVFILSIMLWSLECLTKPGTGSA